MLAERGAGQPALLTPGCSQGSEVGHVNFKYRHNIFVDHRTSNRLTAVLMTVLSLHPMQLAALQYQAYFLDRSEINSIIGFCK